jgi:Protein of unknown function (DUF3999)
MRWRTSLALSFALAVAAGNAAAADSIGDFAERAPIELKGGGPYYLVPLPFEAYPAARFPDMRDLRVFNNAGEAVPFALIRAMPQSEQKTADVAIAWFPIYASAPADTAPDVRVERRSDGTVVRVTGGAPRGSGASTLRGFLLDLSQSKDPAHRLTLDWDPAVTGFQQLTVEASDDLEHWQTWRNDAQLARFEFNGEHVERRVVDLEDRHARYLRLLWRAPATAPGLTAVTLTTASAMAQPAPFVWSAPLAPVQASDGDTTKPAAQASEFEWQFPVPLAPERVKIGLPQENVLAPVSLWGRADEEARTPWRYLAGGVVYRLHSEGHDWEQDEIALATAPMKRLKLKLDRRSGGLGGAPMLSVGLTARQLLFLARGTGPFVLALGDEKAAAADLSPAMLVPGYGSDGAPPISAAELGPLTRAAGLAAASDEPSAAGLTLNWKTATLWAILGTGIVSIAAMALYLLRQMRK